MAILTAILNTLIVLLSLFLICLVLIQRGKGGGLAGAFGGVGGSSAFGTKAGDIFTKVTMIVATVWIFLSLLLVVLYNQPSRSAFDDGSSSAVSKESTSKSKSKTKAGTETGASTAVPPVKTDATTSPAAIPDATGTPAPAK